MSEKIQFQTNVPVELALQFLEGKPVDSQFGGFQHLFSTTDNRVFFVSEMVGNIIADQVKKLQVQKGEPVEICKAEITQGRGRKSIQWIVKKVDRPPAGQPGSTLPKSSPTPPNRNEPLTAVNGSSPDSQTAAPGARPPEHNTHQGWAQALLSQTTALIDVYAAALNYSGTQHGNVVKPEDVKTLLTTAFINLSKQGANHVS